MGMSENLQEAMLKAQQSRKADLYMDDAREALRMAVETLPEGTTTPNVVKRADEYFEWFQQKRKEYREKD